MCTSIFLLCIHGILYGNFAFKLTLIIVCLIKTKYMVMSRDQNAGRIHSVRIDNSTFERVEEFKYLGTTLTNQILLRKKLRAD